MPSEKEAWDEIGRLVEERLVALNAIQDLYDDETAHRYYLRHLDYILEYWGNQYAPFVKLYGLDYEAKGQTLRSVWNKLLGYYESQRKITVGGMKRIKRLRYRVAYGGRM